MKLKLKGWIRHNGVRYGTGTVIDTEALDMSEADAMWLVRRGTAAHVDEDAAAPAPAPAGSEPEVINVDMAESKAETGDAAVESQDELDAGADAELIGVADGDGNVTELADMDYRDLVALAKDLGIEGASKTKKDDLVDLIKAAQKPAAE